MTIHLQNLQFFAFHGLYHEEQVLGNNFIVNVKVEADIVENTKLSIEDTVNYEAIFNVVKQQMETPEELLENLVANIANCILAQFLKVNSVSVSVYKLTPPITGYKGSVGVEFSLHRK